VAEAVGHKLATHHPVIEPVSTKTNPRGWTDRTYTTYVCPVRRGLNF
jgi:hypothetical protein